MATITSVTQTANLGTKRKPVPVANSESTFDAVVNAVNQRLGVLREINSAIHSNPELCFKEFKAHDSITALLESFGFAVEKHAYGLDTSFVSEYGQGGRLVTICSEYDALEGVGHACGHNLIATASIASFLGISAALEQSGAPGRVRILGCPAEEGGGGKIKLIHAGAFKGVDAALMVHASTPLDIPQPAGAAAVGGRSVAIFRGIFTGEPAHAGVVPWNGINALDAASLTYSAISMLRQQIRPTDRLNLYIKEGGQMTNIITARSVVEVGVRTLTLMENEKLQERVRNCFKGAALATGCTIEFESVMDTYADLHTNEPLCNEFTDIMSRHFDSHFHGDMRDPHISGGGSDFGNVSYECPSLHPLFIIPTLPTDNVHAPGFTRAAGEPAAFDAAIKAAKGIALLGVKVLADEEFAKMMREAFEKDVKKSATNFWNPVGWALGTAIVGAREAAPQIMTWDCHKSIIHEDQQTPSKPMLLAALVAHPMVPRVEITTKATSTQLPDVEIENVAGELYLLRGVMLPWGAVAYHAEKTKG